MGCCISLSANLIKTKSEVYDKCLSNLGIKAKTENNKIANHDVQYEFMKNDGVVKMINGNNNNSILAVIQVFLEIDDLKKYFILEKLENAELFKHMSSIFIKTFNNGDSNFKLINIKSDASEHDRDEE